MILVSDLEGVHHEATLADGVLSVGPLLLRAEDFVLADLRFAQFNNVEESALEAAGFLAPKTRYLHFHVRRVGNQTMVTNADDKPHDFLYGADRITIGPHESRIL